MDTRSSDPPARIATLSLIGHVSVAVDGVSVEVATRKARALLAYLALSDTLTETRERLGGLLWSESEEEKARASLRQALRQLRSAFDPIGYGGLETDHLDVRLRREQLRVDVWDVLADAAAGRAHPALLATKQAPELILPEMDDLDPSFRVWLLAKRQTIRERILNGLEATLSSTDIDPREREKAARAIANIDPTHEEAARCLMLRHAGTGDTAGAIRIYNDLWELLDKEYDMEPAQQTIDLVAKIKVGAFGRASSQASIVHSFAGAAATSAPIALREGVARQPGLHQDSKIALWLRAFGAAGLGPDHSYLVEGFRHQLIACLVRFREWYVFDRRPEETSANLPNVSASYGVDVTSRVVGGRVGLALTLKDIASGLFVWSENVELSVESWFEAQQRIVRRIATALNVHLSSERIQQLASQPDVSISVYDRWLRGYAMQLSYDRDKWRQAAAIFDETIHDAPNFSLGYCSKAMLDNARTITFPGQFRDMRRHARNMEIALKAVQLDPIDSRTHLCLAWSNMLSHRFSDGLFHSKIAHELNENDPWTAISAASIMALSGEVDDALSIAEQAAELNPLPSPTHLAYQSVVQFIAGNYERCIALQERAGAGYPSSQAWKVSALAHTGEGERASSELGQMLAGVRARWSGEIEPTDEAIMRWFLHTNPIAVRDVWERLREGLGKAGAPVAGIEFQVW